MRGCRGRPGDREIFPARFPEAPALHAYRDICELYSPDKSTPQANPATLHTKPSKQSRPLPTIQPWRKPANAPTRLRGDGDSRGLVFPVPRLLRPDCPASASLPPLRFGTCPRLTALSYALPLI